MRWQAHKEQAEGQDKRMSRMANKTTNNQVVEELCPVCKKQLTEEERVELGLTLCLRCYADKEDREYWAEQERLGRAQ